MKKLLLTALFALSLSGLTQAKDCPLHAKAEAGEKKSCTAEQMNTCKKKGEKCDKSCVKKHGSESVIQAAIGIDAPDFTLPAHTGKNLSLSSYADKIVVLEWFNEGCPFVKKHYNSGNMQTLQKTYTDKDVVWLSIVSSAKGKQGHMKAKDAVKYVKKKNTAQTAILFDETGDVGKLYGARTTPHMFVIDRGKLVYNGAIDDRASFREEDVKDAKNYVAAALDELLAGKKVSVSQTEPYGCSVKYK